jgi:hypothetical protein
MAPLPATALPTGRGLLRVVSPVELTDVQAVVDTEAANQNGTYDRSAWENSLVGFIDGEFERFTRHRDGGSGWTERITAAMEAFKGVYPAWKLAEIKKFGGSTVYARIVATKCRGASSLLRDVYLGEEIPWGLEATPDPTLPDDMLAAIRDLVMVEAQNEERLSGMAPDPEQIRDRVTSLFASAKMAALKKARREAETSTAKVDDILTEGQFYEALAAFLTDLPLFPFACMKGPIVRIVPQVTWVGGTAKLQDKPKMFWNRVSPYDIWWTPGVSNIADAAVIERSRVSRADLNQLIGLPGYNDENLRTVIREYGRGGYVEATGSSSEQTRANLESRESPSMNESGLMDQLEYHGYVPGQLMLDWGMSPVEVPDPDRDYFVDCYKIGRYVIKCQQAASLKKRPPYYITSFEKVPGTVVGNGLPDILEDVADVGNAALRSLVNNMSIASGPQVVINDDRIAANEDGDELYPWKRWHVESDPMGNSMQAPVAFFNVESHAQELLSVYEKFTQIADDLSAIPRYITGSERVGGAGRTASGLAMLMGNAAKILQTVAANIDNDVIDPVVSELYDMIMLTDQTGMLRGDESIKVLGVNVAVQRETQRQRQLEFLQITGNPIDLQITGIKGRASVLRAVSQSIGLNGEDVVPPDDVLAAQQGGAGGPPGTPPGPGGPAPPGGGPTAPEAPPQQALPGTPGNAAPAPAAPQGPQTNTVGNG